MSSRRPASSRDQAGVAQTQRKRDRRAPASVREKLGGLAILAFWSSDLYETLAQYDDVNQKRIQGASHEDASDNLFLMGEISRDTQKWLLAIDQLDTRQTFSGQLVNEVQAWVGGLASTENHAVQSFVQSSLTAQLGVASQVGLIPVIEIVPSDVVDFSEFSVESSTYKVEVSALGHHTIAPSDLYVSSLMEPTLASSEVKTQLPENLADYSLTNPQSEFDLVDETEYEETQESAAIEPIDINQVAFGGFAISNALLGAAGGAGGAGGLLAIASGLSGRVIDGYVSGATVFSDLNDNATLDWIDGNQNKQWDSGEGEVWAVTDATGQYVFNDQGNATGSIVSLGGIDVTTGAAISVLKAVSGSSIVTPVSTVYAFAEAQSPGSGKDFLQALGLTSEDLLYDPTQGHSSNATTVLKSGASLLVMVNNATAVATAASGSNESTAAIKVFSEIAKLSANQIGGLIGSDAVHAQAQLTAVMTSAVAALGADPTSIASTIETASKATAAVTSAIVNLSSDAIRSGELLQYAQAGQQSLVAEMKALAVSAAAGEDVTSLLSKWSGDNAAASILELKSRAAAKLAFNAQDPNNPVTTIADVFYVSAPQITEGASSPHTEKFSPLTNDLVKGSGELTLIAVGLLDTKAFVGSTLRAVSDTSIALGSSATEGVDYTGMTLTLASGSGSQAYRISHYDVGTKVAQLSSRLDQEFVAASRDGEVAFDYLVSKSLPPNLKLTLDGNLLVVSNAFDQEYQFGSYDLIYVAQDENSNASKTGLITLNIEPPPPNIARANNQVVTVSEANDSAEANTVSALTISGVQKAFTKVPIPIEVTGISPDGAFIVKGLPVDSVLTIKVAGIVKEIEMGGTSNVPLWAIRGGDAFNADFTTLEVYVPSNFAGSFTPEFQATARYAGLATTTTASVAINISPTVDGLRILNAEEHSGVATYASELAPIAVAEDLPSFGLNNQTDALHTLLEILSERLLDVGSEKLAVRLSLPQNFQLVSGGEFANLKVVSNAQPLVVEIIDTTANSIYSTLSSLKFAATEHLSGQEFSIELKVGAYEVITANEWPKLNGINWLVEPFQMEFSIAPSADELNFTTADTTQIQQTLTSFLADNGSEDQPYHFDSEKLKTLLTQAFKGIVDHDGSEQLLVKISVPNGFGVVGENGSQISCEIYADNLDNLVSDLSALSIVSPSDFSGNVEISFAFASVEVNRDGIAQAQSNYSNPFVSTWHIAALSDVPTVDSKLITSAVEVGVWDQDNHRLADGRYEVNIELKSHSTDGDGSELVYTDIQHCDLLYANATLDFNGRSLSNYVSQLDEQGVSLVFSSKLQSVTAPDLTRSGTGLAYLESVSLEPTGSKTYHVTFQNLAAGKSISLAGCTFVAGTSGASANEVAQFFAQQELGAWWISDVQTIWDRLPGDLQSVTVVYASTAAAPGTITMRSVSLDGVAQEAYSDAISLIVPFEEKPIEPTLTLMTGINAKEDVGIALSDLIKVEAGIGRTLDSVKIFIDLPNTFKLVDATNQALSTNSVDSRASYEINVNDLSKIRVLASEPNYTGELSIHAFARDVASSTNSFKDSAIAERSIQIQAVADGFGDHALFTEQGLSNSASPLALKIGAVTTIYDPAKGINLFSGVTSGRIDSQETVGVRLVFKAVDSEAVSMTCGEKFIIPSVRSTAQGTDLVFSLTQAQMSSADAITLLAREGVLGKQISLEAYTLQGVMQSAISTQTVAIQTIIEALSPNVTIGSVVGLEDSAIAIPVKVPVSVDRSAFERTGVKFTIDLVNSSNTNSSATDIEELQKGIFKIKGSGVEFTYDIEKSCWMVFQSLDKPQLDLSQIVFVPSGNYSGSIGLIGTPFSITSSSQSPALGVSSAFKVYVDPVAEPVSLVTSAKEITGVEDRLVPIDFSQYVHLPSLSDANESITFEVQISSQLSIVKAGNSLVPVSVSNDVSRYVLSTTVSNFKEYFLDAKGQTLFSLKPATNFSSQGLGTVAGADRIQLFVSTSELNGNVSKAASLTIPLKISAISDLPPEPIVLKSEVVISESQGIASSANWLKLSEVLGVKNASPADPSEKLEVVLSTTSKLELSIDQKTPLQPVSQTDATATYVVSLLDYAQLFAKGKSFEAGESTLSVRLRSTDFEGTKAVPYVDGIEKTVAVSIKSVASGFLVEPIFHDQVRINEDGEGVLLSEFLGIAAIARDPSEAIFYRVSLPVNVKLAGVGGVSALNAKLVADQITYEIPSDLMSKYQVTPVANFSGDLEIKLTAFSKESDGSMITSSTKVVSYSVAPVSDTPTLLVPPSVSGLISRANPELEAPIYARSTDASESVEVDIYLHDVISADSLLFTLSDGSKLTPTRMDASVPGEWLVHITQDKVGLLPSLKVSSSVDYRGVNSIDVSVIARSQDGLALPVEVTNHFSLSVYQPLPVLTLEAGDGVHAKSIGSLPINLEMPTSLPVGIGASNVSVMLIGAPQGAAFYALDPVSQQPIPIGASLGSGQGGTEPVIWIFKGSDLVDEVNGVWVNRQILVSNDEFSISTVTLQAFMTDPVSGAKSQSLTASTTLDFSSVGIDWNQSTDPLVLSIDGSAIASIKPSFDLAFELNPQSPGAEYPMSWVSGALSANEPSGYAFLVRPDALLIDASALTLGDLYATFGDLVAASSGDISTNLVAENLAGVGLWFDANSDGLFADSEFARLTDLFPNIQIHLPQHVARESTSGSIVSIYEADVDLGNSHAASLFSVAIPYTTSPASLNTVPSNLASVFVSAPHATLQFLGEQDESSFHIPEDLRGGPQFIVDLTKAQASNADDVPMHLIKVFGLSDELSLSQGVRVQPSNGQDSFWILTEDVVATPIRVIGLPENYVGEISLAVEAYASLVTGQGESARNWSVKQVSELSSVTVVIDGVADTPDLVAEHSDVKLEEGGRLSFEDHPLLTLSTSDSSEDLYVRFHLDADPSKYDVLSNSNNSVQLLDANSNIYEVSYADLESVYIQFSDYYAESTDLQMWGVARQASSVAKSVDENLVKINFTPVADGVSNSFDALVDAQGVAVTHEISEGDTLSVHVQATRIDPNELIQFALVMEGEASALSTVRAAAGTQELSWETDAQLNDYLLTQWHITDTGLSKRVFIFEDTGPMAETNDFFETFAFKLDPYRNDSFQIRTASISIDAVHGVSSQFASAVSEVHTIDTKPVINALGISGLLRDVEHGTVLTELNLKEGSSSRWFVLEVASTDADEVLTASLNETNLFDLETREIDGVTQYRLVSRPLINDGFPDVSLHVSLHVAEGEELLDAPNLLTIPVDFVKTVTPPTLDLTGRVLSEDDRLIISLDDQSATGLLQGVIPSITPDRYSDDVTTYILSDVPEWLIPSSGKLVSKDEVTDLSIYYFESEEITNLTWTTTKSRITTDDVTNLQLVALNTESTTLEHAYSDPLTMTLMRHPIAEKPFVLGPTEINVAEGSAPVPLSTYSVGLVGFSEVEILHTVEVGVTLSSGLSLFIADHPQSIAQGPGTEWLSLEDFYAASVSTTDLNDFGNFAISIVARQVVGESMAQSDVVSATVSVSNIPEDVELSVSGSWGEQVQTIIEGGEWQLPSIAVTEQAPGETTVILLTVNPQFEIWHQSSPDVWGALTPVSIENDRKSFEIDPQDLVDGTLKISAPERAQLGAFDLQIQAQSVDSKTGLVGKTDQISIVLDVQPHPDTPIVQANSVYVIAEDAGQIATPLVLSLSSPDSREEVELQVVLEGPNGEALKISDGFALFINGVRADGLLMVSAQDPISLLTVSLPTNFYNVSKDWEILSPYSIHISARSVFSVDEKLFYSERVDRWLALDVLSVNDVPQLSVVGNSAMQLTEGGASQSVAGLFKFSDVDLYDVIEPTVYLVSTAYQDDSGQALFFQNQNVDDFLHVISQKSSGNANTGDLLFTLNPSSTALNFLGAGESISMRWGVKIDDGNGGTDTKFIDAVVRGTNDSPTAIDRVEGGLRIEPSLGSEVNLTLNGTFNFDDVDFNDLHTVEVVTPENSVGAFIVQKSVDSQGDMVGEISWTYRVDPQEIDYLAFDQLLEQTYKVRVLDGTQAASETLVKVQIKGTGDLPTVTAHVYGGTQSELRDSTDSSVIHISQGEVSFGDVDLTDTHVVIQGASPEVYINGVLFNLNAPYGLEKQSCVQMLFENSVFEISVAEDSTASGFGTLKWRYALPDDALDFLSKDETLEIAYPLTIRGNEDKLAQDFQLTLRLIGENDAPQFTASELVHLAPAQEINGSPTEGMITESVVLDFMDADLSDEFFIDVKPLDRSDSVGDITLAPINRFGEQGHVELIYQVNAKDVEYLSLGEVLSEEFLVTLTDKNGKSTLQVIAASVVGSNDAPTWLKSSASEVVQITESEDSSSIQTVVTRQFHDVDLADANHQLQINFVGAQGDLASDALADSDYLRMISNFDVHRTSGNSVGEVSIDFAFKSKDFDYLSLGESVDLLYQIAVADEHLAQSEFQDVLIHIEGSNDRLFVIESETLASGKIVEIDDGTNGTYGAHGKIVLRDVDISDRLAFVDVENVLNPMGLIRISNSENTEETNLSRSFNWSYEVSSESIEFLAQYEKTTEKFILVFSDGQGGQVGQSINIELVGTNDSPYVLVDESLSYAQITELVGGSRDEADLLHQREGRILFEDIDSIDTHNLLYVASESDYVGQFSAYISSDTELNASGVVIWTFDVNDEDLDFLAEGETLVQEYVIKLSDGAGASVEQTVNVTLTGKDDAPIAKDTYTTLTTLEKPFVFQLSDFSKAVIDPDSEIKSITIESLPNASGSGGSGTLGMLAVGLSIDDSLVTDDGQTRYRPVAKGELIEVDEIDRLIFIPDADSVAPRFSFSVQAGGVQSNSAEFSIYSSLVLNEDNVRDLTFDDFVHFLDSSFEYQDEIRLEVLTSAGGDLYVGSERVQGKTSLATVREDGVIRLRDLVRFVPEPNMSGINASTIQFQMRDSLSGWIAGAIVMTVLPVVDASLSPVFAAQSPVYFEMGDSLHTILIDANSDDGGEFYELTAELQQNGSIASYAVPRLSLNLPGQGPAILNIDPLLNSLTQDPNFSFAQPLHLSITGSAVDEKLSAHLIPAGLTSQVMVLPNLEFLSGHTQDAKDYRAQIFGANDTDSTYQPAGNDFSYFDDVMQVDDISFISADHFEIISTASDFNGALVSGVNMNVYGSSASDIILASENSKNSLIDGAGGRDFIYGSDGNETVILSEGFDAVMTGTGSDAIVLAADMAYEVLSRQEMETLLSMHVGKNDALHAAAELDALFSGSNRLAGYVSDFDIANDNLVLTGFKNENYQTSDIDMTSSGGKHLIAVTVASQANQSSDYVSVLLDVTQSSISFDAFNTEFIHKA